MITVIIPTLNDEPQLVRLLAVLVPGAGTGLVREVILADGGSADDTARVAELAGCIFQRGPNDPGARLRRAAAGARGEWLMFLMPSAMLTESWLREVPAFIERAEHAAPAEPPAAAFRLGYDGYGVAPRLAEMLAALRHVVMGARPEQGLLIAKRFYHRLGGHEDGAAAPRRLLRCIGRRSLVRLATRVVLSDR